MNRRKRWRTLRFEGLETRVLLAADLFAAVEAPVTDVCVSSYCETASDGASGDVEFQQTTPEQVVHVNISAADRGSQEDIVISDLAFAELGGELSTEQTAD